MDASDTPPPVVPREAAPGAARPASPADGVGLDLGVVIASFRRPDDLARCLASLASLAPPADRVLVVARDDDRATIDAADAARARHGASLPLRVVPVGVPGTVAARNAGIDAADTAIIAFIDDDTVVPPDWAGRIVAHFAADPHLGGLGGRDRCHDGTRFDDRERGPVGRVQWFGRLVGNHHLGAGPAREAEWLKGANMAFRRTALAAIRFREDLRGRGAQPAEDLALSLAVTRAGWRTVYDPAVTLDHYAARRDDVRHYVGGAGFADPDGYYDFCFNNTLAVRAYLTPVRRLAHAAWSRLVGIGIQPGLVQLARLARRDGASPAWHRFRIAQRAYRDASRHLRTGGAAAAARRAAPRRPPSAADAQPSRA